MSKINFYGRIIICLTATAVCTVLLFQQVSHSGEFRWIKKIAPGIYYTHIKTSTPRGPLHIHILKINTTLPEITVRPAIARGRIGGIERVDDIAERENAIAAVNGSFFESRRFPHLPIGMLIIDGEIVNKSTLNRAAMGITGNGYIVFGIPKIKGEVINGRTKESFNIWGINRPRKKNEVIFYTSEYGPTTRTNKSGKELTVTGGRVVAISDGNSAIPADGCVLSFHGWTKKYIYLIPIGSDIIINFGLTGNWEMVDQAVTGGPLLIQDGQIVADNSVTYECFDGEMLQPSARTAAGVNGKGEMLLFVVDRRPGLSVGVNYMELANIMKNEDVVDGMGLDGGGSSTMYVDGEIKNFTMYGHPYPVADALIVEREGYKYVARKPKPIILARKPVFVEAAAEPLKPPASPEEISSVPSVEAYVPPNDLLLDIYNKLILPMITTREVTVSSEEVY